MKRIIQKIKNIYKRNLCIYCNERIWKDDEKHFRSVCCGRGMCESCYVNLQGTEEQFQIDYMEEEDLEQFFYGTNIEKKNGGDYICFECCDNGNVYKLK